MAFSFNNPLSSALNSLPSKFSDQALTSTSENIIDSIERLNENFAFCMRKESEELLTKKGVELAPVSFRVHSHPVCKTIENHLIYRVVPLTFSKIPSISIISMREEKVEKMLKIRNFSKYGQIQALKPLNSLIDSKDNFRYLDSGNLSTNHESMTESLRNECLRNGWFPKVVFVHDELHFWEPKHLLAFFSKIPEIKQMVGTVILPPELLLNEKVSKNPRVYTFDLDGDDLAFFPDGVASEGYVQKLSTSAWWMKTSLLSDGTCFLRISIIQSIFAHHLISVDRGSMLQKNFFFEKPECLLNQELSLLASKLADGVIERSTMSSILVYLSCLKTPNQESALAKLRQLEKRDLYPDEAFLVASISSTFVKHSLGSPFDDSLLDSFCEKIFNKLPSFIQSSLNHDKHWSGVFRHFMSEISVKFFKVKRTELLIQGTATVIDPLPFLDDKSPAPYSFSRRVSERSNLLGLLLSGNLFGDSGVVACPPLRVFPARSPPQGVFTPTGPFLLEFGVSSITDMERVAETPADTFSSTGAIVENAMELCSFEKSSVRASTRKNSCVFDSFSFFLEESTDSIIDTVFNSDISGELFDAIENDEPLSVEMIHEVAICLDCLTYVQIGNTVRKFNLNGSKQVFILLHKGHATPIEKDCFSRVLGEGGIPPISSSVRQSLSFPKINSGLLPFCNVRAQALLRSINNGCTGIMREISPEAVSGLVNAFEKPLELLNHERTFNFRFSLCLGIPGSGKSFEIRKWLLDNPTFQCLVVSPRRALAQEWVESLKGTAHKVCTFEAALCTFAVGFKGIVLDEISLYPPGFTDLLVLILTLRKEGIVRGDNFFHSKFNKWIEDGAKTELSVYALGDCLQTIYYSSLDSLLLSKTHDLNRLIEKVEGPVDYLWSSFRLPEGFKKILDFQCLSKVPFEDFKVFSEISATRYSDYGAILVASQEDKRNVSCPLLTMTFGESQGLTFEKKVLIGISSDTVASSEQAVIVALTRSRIGFDFVFMGGKSYSDIKLIAKKKILGYVLERKAVPSGRLENLIPTRELNKIFRSGGLEEKASNDLFILPEIEPNFPVPEEIELEAIESQPLWFRTHIPISSVNPLIGEIFDKMRAKEAREFYHTRRGFSEQFPDTDKGLLEEVMGFSFRFDAVFPRHQGSDDVTFWEGVKKRLRFSNPRTERSKLEEARKQAPRLLDIFLKALPNDFKVSQRDIEKGLNSFNDKRAEKSEALWKAHSERSDIDWPINHIFLFMKSQLCTKEEKMFSDAKAGQTLACFHHSVLFRFGPFLRAIESAFIRACGDSYYIHSGKNFCALNEFVIMNSELFQGRSIESDYEAFDSSQDAVILAFEEALLRFLGISEGFIADYVTIKLNLGCRLGSLAIMRFTGEFCTFLFNTFANMLFTFIKYDVDSRRDRILFAGDDMASLGALRQGKKTNLRLLELFSLKAKEQVKAIPMFCGWFLTPDGILKSPRLLWARICTMKQRGLISKCLDNYFLEAVFAYNLGEKLFQYFNETDLEYHYVVSRFFIKNSYKFSGESRTSFYGIRDSFGSKCQSSRSMTSQSELKRKILKLMLLNPQTSMATLLSSSRKFYNQSGGLKVISKLEISQAARRPSQIFLSWILSRWIILRSSLRAIRTSTLVPFWSASHHSCQIFARCPVELSCMTRLHWMLKVAISRVSAYVSTKVRPFLRLGLNIFCHQLTRCLEKLSRSISRSKELILKKLVRFLVSTLDVSIGFPIQLAIFVKTMVMGGGPSKKFGDATRLNSQGPRLKTLYLGLRNWGLTSLISMSNSRVEASFQLLDKLEERGLFLDLSKSWELELRDFLGQPQLDLIIHLRLLKKMASVQDVIRSAIRQETCRWVWNTQIDADHAVLVEGTHVDQAPQDRVGAVRAFMQHYNSHLFGNIALLGSSGKTAWPNVEITLAGLTQSVGAVQVTKNLRINLSVVLQAFEAFRASSGVELFKNATFRQVCECFASETYIFLKHMFSQGVSTNIYKKWPRAFDSAPWVAFDFASGLRMHNLTPDEKKVLDRLTKRLFRTEGQKGVFEAGQEVNVDLEG